MSILEITNRRELRRMRGPWTRTGVVGLAARSIDVITAVALQDRK
jgi:hypothetical protein